MSPGAWVGDQYVIHRAISRVQRRVMTRLLCTSFSDELDKAREHDKHDVANKSALPSSDDTPASRFHGNSVSNTRF